jgi:hypothetical protein
MQMTRGDMARRDLFQGRALGSATRAGHRAARVEVAAGWRVERRGDFALQRCKALLASGQRWYVGEKGLRIRMLRPFEEIDSAGTFHDAAQIHDHHAV